MDLGDVPTQRKYVLSVAMETRSQLFGLTRRAIIRWQHSCPHWIQNVYTLTPFPSNCAVSKCLFAFSRCRKCLELRLWSVSRNTIRFELRGGHCKICFKFLVHSHSEEVSFVAIRIQLLNHRKVGCRFLLNGKRQVSNSVLEAALLPGGSTTFFNFCPVENCS